MHHDSDREHPLDAGVGAVELAVLELWAPDGSSLVNAETRVGNKRDTGPTGRS